MCAINSCYRQEFAKLLREITIPSHIDKKSKYEHYNRLNSYITKNMPKSLFRYRSTEPHNIEALRRGYISVTKPSEMGDIFDSQIAVDTKQVLTEIKKMEGMTDDIANHIYEGKPLPDFALQAVSPLIRRVVVSNQGFIKGNLVIKPLMRFLAATWGTVLRKRAKNELKRTVDILRETGYIACFCEDVNRASMWDRYADKHKGYTLEYEFETLNARFHIIDIADKCLQPDYIVLPVIYGEKYDSTLIILHSLINRFMLEKAGNNAYIHHPDELWCIKGYLYKSDEYKHESEWRLITPLNGVAPDVSPYASVTAEPKAIYYGAKMTDKTRQELDVIAQQKGLKRYSMEINPIDIRVDAFPL